MTGESKRANAVHDHAAASFIVGGGETGALMRHLHWATTPLGEAGRCPPSLRTSINNCVSSRFPIALYWGPDVMLYNDELISIRNEADAVGGVFCAVLETTDKIIEELAFTPLG